jgi:hypothetical protein
MNQAIRPPASAQIDLHAGAPGFAVPPSPNHDDAVTQEEDVQPVDSLYSDVWEREWEGDALITSHLDFPF